MSLNAKDNGRRRFVLVQVGEIPDPKSEAAKAGYSTIAEISKERLRRAGRKIVSGQKGRQNGDSPKQATLLSPSEHQLAPPPPDIGFRLLKIDTSNMKDVYYAPDAIQQPDLLAHLDNIREDRTPEDLLFHVLVDWGVGLDLPIATETVAGKTVYFVDGNSLAACFDSNISEDLVKELAKRKPLVLSSGTAVMGATA